MGRIDFQVKVNGFRIEPGEIEAVAAEAQGVREAVATVREDTPGLKRIVLYATPADADVEAALAACKRKLPHYMVPSAVVTLESWPRTGSGKIDRKALPAPTDGGGEGGEAVFVAAATALEASLADAFQAVLGLQSAVSTSASFFDLGGNSLAAVRLVHALRAADNIGGIPAPLGLADVFGHPTVSGLAGRIRALRAESDGGAGAALARPPLVPAPAADLHPLSANQEQMLVLFDLDRTSPVYNMAHVQQVEEKLDTDSSAPVPGGAGRPAPDAADALVEQDAETGVTMQRVVPMLEYELALDVFVEADAAGSSAASGSVPRREAFMARLCEAPFDLHAGPWVRFGLLRHASDAGGGSTLVRGDAPHCGGRVVDRGLGSRAPCAHQRRRRHPVTLIAAAGGAARTAAADGAVHGLRALAAGVLSVVSESQLAYWRATLGHGGPAPLELPTDRPRPKLQTFNGAYTAVAVDGEVVASLEGVRRRAGATMFMVLLAAFQLLLSRYSRQEAVCVGSPYAGRDEAGTQGIVGYFDSTLALLLELSGEPTFVELLGRARSAALGAFAHADVPFARVVDALGVARDASRTPVFQAMFVLLAERTDAADSGMSDNERGDGVASDLDDDSETIGTAKFDLTLFVEGSLERGSLEYNTDLFDGATARHMAAHFARLLRSIAAAPTAAASTLELMDDDGARPRAA